MNGKSASIRAWWQSVLTSKPFFISVGLVPLFVIYFLFYLYPISQSFQFSFYRYNLLGVQKFIGFDNFRKALGDELFIKSLINTFYYILGTVGLGTLLSLMIAIFINSFKRVFWSSLLRIAFFLPLVTSLVVAAVMWRWIGHHQFGVLNMVLGYFGIAKVNWLRDPVTAMPFLILISIWHGMGFNIIIFLAGLQGIPRNFYEAASVDGASWWDHIKHITIPLIKPIVLVLLIRGVILGFQMFDLVYVLTKGGPLNVTRVVFFHVYQKAFRAMLMGYGLAMNLLVFIIIFALTMIQFWVIRTKWEL